MTKVTQRSALMLSSRSFNLLRAFAGSASDAKEYFASAARWAISIAAANPWPTTLPTTTAVRPSGSGM